MKKNNNKNSSARRKLAAAIAMLMISTLLLSSATYAWFTMSKDVTVTGMQVKATTDFGLVISGDAKTTWTTDWDVEMPEGVALYPTNTNGDGTDIQWVANTSRYFDDADKNQSGTYTDLSLSYEGASGTVFAATGEGIGYNSGSNLPYVLKKTFYIKSTGEGDWTQKLVVSEVTASVNMDVRTGSGSEALNKSLRVLVVVTDYNNTVQGSFIYAPVDGYDSGTKFKGAGSNLALVSSDTPSDTTITTIYNTDDKAIKVDMYMYFEGEDFNCKSSNITAIDVDSLMVSAKFSAADV